MGYNFGNNASDGHHAHSYVYAPTWERSIDYNPDHQPSRSAMFIEDRGRNVLCVLQVKGFGVITLRGTYEEGPLQFAGMAIFTKDEIGHSPTL